MVLSFAIGIFGLSKLIRTFNKLNLCSLTLSILSITFISFSYSNLRSDYRIATQVDQSVSKLITYAYLSSPVKQNPNTQQATMHITRGNFTGIDISVNIPPAISLKPAVEYKLLINLYPISKTNNIDNFDFANYYLANNISAAAQLIEASYIQTVNTPAALINKWRSNLIEFLAISTSGYKYSGFYIALATGYQSYIPREQWDMFQKTGINHIVSISGLHLTLVTGFFILLLSLALKKLPPTKIPQQIILAICGVIFATGYALLAGFGIPIQRALYMLIISSYLMVNRKYLPIMYQLSICLAISLIINPFAVFSIGFWFSYTLIAGIMFNLTQQNYQDSKYKKLLKMQIVVILLGMTISLFYFSKVSFISAIANIWAVPVLGTIFTPTVLISALLHSTLLIKIVVSLLTSALYPIELLNNISMFSQAKPNLCAVILAYLGIAIFILRINISHKNTLALLFFSCIFFISNPKIRNGTAKIITFSNNTAGISLIQTRTSNSLYYNNESSSNIQALNTLIPYLQAKNINEIDYLVTPYFESVTNYLANNQITVKHQLIDKEYLDGIYLLPLDNKSLLVQNNNSLTYISDCRKIDFSEYKIDNIIIPIMLKNCNWIYQQSYKNLVINGNNKSQSKIDRLFSNLNFSAEFNQNISNGQTHVFEIQ